MRNVCLGILLCLAVLVVGCARAHYFTNPTTKAIMFEANDAQHQPTVISVEQ